MSFLSRAEIGPALALGPGDAAKARRVVADVERLMLTATGVGEVQPLPGRTRIRCPEGIEILIHDHGPGGVSIYARDSRDRHLERSIHLYGRPAHLPHPGQDVMATLHRTLGLVSQCIRVASSTSALRPGATGIADMAGTRRHAMRLVAEHVASGHVPTDRVGEEIRVHHPWGDVPATQTDLIHADERHGPVEIGLPRLLEVSVHGPADDRDLHVGGAMRKASPHEIIGDAVETMRLVAELASIRNARDDPNSFIPR